MPSGAGTAEGTMIWIGIGLFSCSGVGAVKGGTWLGSAGVDELNWMTSGEGTAGVVSNGLAVVIPSNQEAGASDKSMSATRHSNKIPAARLAAREDFRIRYPRLINIFLAAPTRQADPHFLMSTIHRNVLLRFCTIAHQTESVSNHFPPLADFFDLRYHRVCSLNLLHCRRTRHATEVFRRRCTVLRALTGLPLDLARFQWRSKLLCSGTYSTSTLVKSKRGALRQIFISHATWKLHTVKSFRSCTVKGTKPRSPCLDVAAMTLPSSKRCCPNPGSRVNRCTSSGKT